ncbi:hypothetical protein [Robiginitalea biformata]|uniref:Uncharacterized protein n=1 Tax=Robiginitalea biformata (strain ATCC BAA-864 / DSM 15991 / KCTC 12146 / HTCC2501) TaxID=313596 RepID=A4CKP4_ROBBH|nr:hypothetical protein [Robiginitalea biformata]EAR15443.1 hypothetical protein RB2501_13984 [Robiginitalea biformata HTCC2501]
MVGLKRLNADRTLFTREGRLIMKNEAAGNIDQRGEEVNDWSQGPIGTNYLTGWAKYRGGAKTDPANYDIPDFIERDAYPDV